MHVFTDDAADLRGKRWEWHGVDAPTFSAERVITWRGFGAAIPMGRCHYTIRDGVIERELELDEDVLWLRDLVCLLETESQATVAELAAQLGLSIDELRDGLAFLSSHGWVDVAFIVQRAKQAG